MISSSSLARLEQCVDLWIDRYSAGWLEVYADILIQLSYLAFGIIVELIRPPYDSKTSKRMMRQSLRNHATGALTHICYVWYTRGNPVLTRTWAQPYSLPSWREMVSDMVVALILRDAVSYLIHRIWHLPGVYKLVHAKHHEILKPGQHHVWTVSYMSMIDFNLLYGGPVVLIARFLEMNILTVGLFAFISAVGEQVKLIYGDEAHEEHHISGSTNFGPYGIVDAVLGTTPGLSLYTLYLH